MIVISVIFIVYNFIIVISVIFIVYNFMIVISVIVIVYNRITFIRKVSIFNGNFEIEFNKYKNAFFYY